jgi:hypothetical protein
VFTLRVLDTAGDVGDGAMPDFLAAGYTTQNALEVVLGVGTYTMSTLANRLTGAPVDDQLAAYAWALSCSMTQIDGERWAIAREMTGFPPVDPHPTLPAR